MEQADKFKVFVSWSGPTSLKAARLIAKWLDTAFDNLDVFFSEETRKGVTWLIELLKELSDTDIAIVCLTPGSVNTPWMLFEIGAIAKKVERSAVIPILIGVQRSTLVEPLSIFQNVIITKEDFQRLAETLSQFGQDHEIDTLDFDARFKRYWKSLGRQLSALEDDAKKEDNGNRGTLTTESKRLSHDSQNEALQIEQDNAYSEEQLSRFVFRAKKLKYIYKRTGGDESKRDGSLLKLFSSLVSSAKEEDIKQPLGIGQYVRVIRHCTDKNFGFVGRVKSIKNAAKRNYEIEINEKSHHYNVVYLFPPGIGIPDPD